MKTTNCSRNTIKALFQEVSTNGTTGAVTDESLLNIIEEGEAKKNKTFMKK